MWINKIWGVHSFVEKRLCLESFRSEARKRSFKDYDMHRLWYRAKEERSIVLWKDVQLRKRVDSESKIIIQSSKKGILVKNREDRQYNKAEIDLQTNTYIFKVIEWK